MITVESLILDMSNQKQLYLDFREQKYQKRLEKNRAEKLRAKQLKELKENKI